MEISIELERDRSIKDRQTDRARLDGNKQHSTKKDETMELQFLSLSRIPSGYYMYYVSSHLINRGGFETQPQPTNPSLATRTNLLRLASRA